MSKINVYNVRLVKEKCQQYDFDDIIVKPNDLLKCANNIFELNTRSEEVFAIIVVNTKNRIIGMFEVSVGSLDSSIVHPREIFKRVLLCNGSGIFLVHNHPSGDTKPSQIDLETTNRIIEGAKILGLRILDHIIIGHDNDYMSFKERGLIN